MVLLGATAALSRARAIPGLTIAENGDVLRITREPVAVYTELEHAYASFAGSASRALANTLKGKMSIA